VIVRVSLPKKIEHLDFDFTSVSVWNRNGQISSEKNKTKQDKKG
jgi:hypothetical protein